MSELKAYIAPTADGTGLADYYLKSEVDKVFRRLKTRLAHKGISNQRLEADKNNNWRKYCAAMAELRHQKYKRCLAMAEWCEVTALWCYQAANTLPRGFHATLYGKPVMIEPSRLFKRSERLDNWVNRWRKLAEKFKPNKSTAQ